MPSAPQTDTSRDTDMKRTETFWKTSVLLSTLIADWYSRFCAIGRSGTFPMLIESFTRRASRSHNGRPELIGSQPVTRAA